MNLDPEPLQPGATIGLLGGGQLAQMLVLAGHAMGSRFMVLVPNTDCPAVLAPASAAGQLALASVSINRQPIA